MSLKLHNMEIIQSNNEYLIYTPHGLLIAHIAMPPDGQFVKDGQCLSVIAKAFSIRWGFFKSSK